MPGTRDFKTGGTTLVKSVGKLGIFPGTLDYLSQFQPCPDFPLQSRQMKDSRIYYGRGQSFQLKGGTWACHHGEQTRHES